MTWLVQTKQGSIFKEDGAKPQSHERITAEALLFYDDVCFIRASRIMRENTPDIIWLNLK